jgi:hypothetical protein
LNIMDAIDEQAERVTTASEPGATPIDSNLQEADQRLLEQEVDEEAAEVERAVRVRRRRDMLQQELEIVAMEQQLDVLRRARNAGYTPVASASVDAGYENNSEARSVAGSALESPAYRRGTSSRPRLKEPDTFKGKTLKEARDFIRSLELVFALAPEAYSSEREKILYGVMFLAGEPRETWHQNHSLQELDRYGWEDFKSFVLDAVEDPVNRSLSTTVAYESARQGEGQTVQAFATELATLEEQMDAYTPTQRTRHLLAKLKPALRTAIITYHEVPKRREDLVSLATRLESAGRQGSSQVPPASTKRDAGTLPSRNIKRYRPSGGHSSAPKEGSPTHAPSRPGAGGSSLAGVQCYNCHEYGHYSSSCKKEKRDRGQSVRKVSASAPKAKKAPEATEKPRE